MSKGKGVIEKKEKEKHGALKCARNGVCVAAETMLCRLMMGSGLVGLGGMLPTTYWAAHPTLPIVRPLLNCHKVQYIPLASQLFSTVKPFNNVGCSLFKCVSLI